MSGPPTLRMADWAQAPGARGGTINSGHAYPATPPPSPAGASLAPKVHGTKGAEEIFSWCYNEVAVEKWKGLGPWRIPPPPTPCHLVTVPSGGWGRPLRVLGGLPMGAGGGEGVNGPEEC